MGRLWTKAPTITTSLDRSASIATLNALANAIRDALKTGGTYDIGATDVVVQWNNTALEVVVENDGLSAVTADRSALQTAIKNACEAQASISSVTAADIVTLDQSYRASTAGASWAPSHTSASAPTGNNDSSDTAGLGKTFGIGSVWIRTSTPREVYICEAATPTAAVWVDTLAYTPSAGANWPSTAAPTRVGAALDAIAARRIVKGRYFVPTVPSVGAAWSLWFPDQDGVPLEDAILTAVDQSGNGSNGTQATHTNAPKLVMGAGGMRLARFSRSLNQRLSLGTTTKPAAWTAVAVVRSDDTALGRMYVCGSVTGTPGSATSWGSIHLHNGGTGKVSYAGGDGTNLFAGTTTNAVAPPRKIVVIMIRYAGSPNNDCDVRINGGSSEALSNKTTTATSSGGTGYEVAYGRDGAYTSYVYDGDIGMVGLWKAALTDGDMTTLAGELKEMFEIA